MELQEEIVKEVKCIANNTLYIGDDTEYEMALWEILGIVAPDLFVNNSLPELHYIDE